MGKAKEQRALDRIEELRELTEQEDAISFRLNQVAYVKEK